MGPVIDNRAADALQAGFGALIGRGGDVIRPLARRDMTRPLLSPGLIDVMLNASSCAAMASKVIRK